MSTSWDYLILTASSARQAAGYESQLSVRRGLGRLADVGTVLVVPDPQGKRVGSGASTLYCLMRVLEEQLQRTRGEPADLASIERTLRGLRILIIHAGGDSRRVPAYGPCGKIFSPVPGETDAPIVCTLFDRMFPIFRQLPRGCAGAGQVVVTAGDAMMLFDPSGVRLDEPGIAALGAYATPEAASKHGVFCVDGGGGLRRFLQKPSPAAQARWGAVDPGGRTILDIAVMSFDAAAAAAMFRAFDVVTGPTGPTFAPAMERLVIDRGMDLYREICCALGAETTADEYRAEAAASGSTWPAEPLAKAHRELTPVPCRVQVLPRCDFLHFGTTRQLVTSGIELLRYDLGSVRPGACLNLNNYCAGDGRIEGADSWIEGCRIAAPVRLAGHNVVVGVDVDEPLELRRGACLDVVPGRTPDGRAVWFVRCYDMADTFKDPIDRGGTFLGRPMRDWVAAVGARPENFWDGSVPASDRSLWNARVFPAAASPGGYRDWLWMFDPPPVEAAQNEALLAVERYSAAEIAVLADLEAFYGRRTRLCTKP